VRSHGAYNYRRVKVRVKLGLVRVRVRVTVVRKWTTPKFAKVRITSASTAALYHLEHTHIRILLMAFHHA